MISVVAAVIEDAGRFLVTRRLEGVHLAGLWEFPGGKIDQGETHEQALRREILEELGADVRIGNLVLHTTHDYRDRSVALHFYRCHLQGTPQPVLGQEMRWVTRTELTLLPFPPADAELIAVLTSDAT